MFQKIAFLKNPHCMAWRAGEFGFVYCREREPHKRAAESHQEQHATGRMGMDTPGGVPKKPGTFPDPEQERKETAESFPPLGSSVWIFSLEIPGAPNIFRLFFFFDKFPTGRQKHDM